MKSLMRASYFAILLVSLIINITLFIVVTSGEMCKKTEQKQEDIKR